MARISIHASVAMAACGILLMAMVGGRAGIAADNSVRSRVLYAPHTGKPSGRHGLPSSRAWRHVPCTRVLTGAINGAATKFVTVARYHTRVWVLWRAHTLYIRFVCRGAAHGISFHANNQPLYQQDVVEVFLDVAGSMKHYAEIEVSPHGFHAVYRHCWTTAPTFPAAAINWRQVDKYHRESLWHIPGLQTVSTTLETDGKKTGWVATLAIPIRPIFKLSGSPATLHQRQCLRANFLRYVYLPAKHGKRTLHQLNWVPTMLGQPHVSPMAMGTIILVGYSTRMPHAHCVTSELRRHVLKVKNQRAHHQSRRSAESIYTYMPLKGIGI